MRVNFGLIPLAMAAYGWVASAQEVASENFLEARELFDESTRFERRAELITDFTTRELVDELTNRLERRGGSGGGTIQPRSGGMYYPTYKPRRH